MGEQPLNPMGTSSYPLFKPEMGIPIGTSVGQPKWMPGLDQVNEFKPFGLLHGHTEFEFRLKYMARLDEAEGKIHRRLQALSQKYPGQTLVFLCWEDLRKPDLWCHRQMISEWLSLRGVQAPELSTGEVFDSAPKKGEPPPKPWEAQTLFDEF